MKFRDSEKTDAIMMMAPAVIFVLLFFVYPLFYSFYLSFRNYSPIKNIDDFVLVGGFLKVLHSKLFISALLNNLRYVGIVLAASTIIALGMALLVNTRFRGYKLVTVIIVLPMLFVPAASAVLWTLAFHRDIGIVNHILDILGFARTNWLSSPTMALYCSMLTDIWAWTPWTFLILFAGLQNLPKEPVEAAVIDGASSLQIFRYITIPLLRSVLVVAVVLKTVFLFKTFDYVWVMTQGGPADSSHILSTYIYKTAFKHYKYGLASSMAVIMLLIILGTSVILIKSFSYTARRK